MNNLQQINVPATKDAYKQLQTWWDDEPMNGYTELSFETIDDNQFTVILAFAEKEDGYKMLGKLAEINGK